MWNVFEVNNKNLVNNIVIDGKAPIRIWPSRGRNIKFDIGASNRRFLKIGKYKG